MSDEKPEKLDGGTFTNYASEEKGSEQKKVREALPTWLNIIVISVAAALAKIIFGNW